MAVGNHYIQASFIGKNFPLEKTKEVDGNKSKKNRVKKVRLLKTEDLKSANNCVEFESKISIIKAEKVFTDYFLCEVVERNHKICEIESNFFRDFIQENMDLSKFSNLVIENRDVFSNYIALSNERSLWKFLNFLDLCLKYKNRETKYIIETCVYNEMISDEKISFRQAVNDLHNDDPHIFIHGCKKIFNIIYPIQMKHKLSSWGQYALVTLKLGVRLPMVSHMVFCLRDLNIDLNVSEELTKELSERFKNILDQLFFIRLSDLDFGVLFPEGIAHPNENLCVSFSKDFNLFLNLLSEILMKCSYPCLVCTDYFIELAKNSFAQGNNFKDFFIEPKSVEFYEMYKHLLKPL